MKRHALALLLLLFGCTSSPAPEKKTFTISYSLSPLTGDPRRSGDVVTSLFLGLLYEGLYRKGPLGEIELGAADSVDISSDGLIYRFHLRDAKWSDGHPVTAYDFESSWKSHLTPNFPSLTCYLLYPIRNAQAAREGTASLDSVGIRALDASTLEIELTAPYPLFPLIAAFPSLLPCPVQEDVPIRAGIVGNGPYQLVAAATDVAFRLEKNPHYWDRDQISIDTLEIHVIKDENTALQLWEKGELDWLGTPLAPLPLDALSNLSHRLKKAPMAGTTFLAYQTEVAPLNNVHLRRALSFAIDRDRLTRDITQGGELPATRSLPPPLSLGEGDSLYNPERAREEMALANLPPHTTLTLTVTPGHLERKLGELLQASWKEVLGLSVSLEISEGKQFKARLVNRQFEIALSFWIAQIPDPMNILERFKERHNPKNYMQWEHAAYRDALDHALASPQLDTRLIHLRAAEDVLMDEMPLTPLYHWTSYHLFGPRIESLTLSSDGVPLFPFARLREDTSRKK